MNKIEETAKEFVEIRRQKIIAKANRSKFINKCFAKNNRQGSYYGIEPSEDNWCDDCKKSAKYHREFHRCSAKASGLLWRLENAVKSL